MKLVEEQHNGATLIFTKDGVQPLDDAESNQKLAEILYVNN